MIDIHNPVSDIALPKPDRSSDKVIRASELERLLEKLSPTMKLIVELAYETAMRRSEILKLTKDCIHLKDRSCRVTLVSRHTFRSQDMTTTSTIDVVSYCRVSTRGQGESGLGLEAQLEYINRAAQQNG